MSDMDSEAMQLLTRLEVKVDALLRRHDDHEARLRTLEAQSATTPTQLADHEVRLRGIERWRWLVTGAAAAGGGAVGGVIASLLGG